MPVTVEGLPVTRNINHQCANSPFSNVNIYMFNHILTHDARRCSCPLRMRGLQLLFARLLMNASCDASDERYKMYVHVVITIEDGTASGVYPHSENISLHTGPDEADFW